MICYVRLHMNNVKKQNRVKKEKEEIDVAMMLVDFLKKIADESVNKKTSPKKRAELNDLFDMLLSITANFIYKKH